MSHNLGLPAVSSGLDSDYAHLAGVVQGDGVAVLAGPTVGAYAAD